MKQMRLKSETTVFKKSLTILKGIIAIATGLVGFSFIVYAYMMSQVVGTLLLILAGSIGFYFDGKSLIGIQEKHQNETKQQKNESKDK